MLADPTGLGNLLETAGAAMFEPRFWADRGELVDATGGRGSAWFIGAAPQAWALRHSRRGGFIARFIQDRYVWAGELRVRAFAEWRLLQHLWRRQLPVPKPLAARYQRRGLTYRCDLITQRIAGAESLSALLAREAVNESVWRAVGAAIARLHAAGADHADLNAHNILVGPGGVSVIDFDRGRLRAPGAWEQQNLARLRRSLSKISRGHDAQHHAAQLQGAQLQGAQHQGAQHHAARFGAREWRWLLAGYASV